MRIRRWVMTQRQKRFFRNVALVFFSLLLIGVVPIMLWVFLVIGIAYGLWKFALHVREEKHGGTRTI